MFYLDMVKMSRQKDLSSEQKTVTTDYLKSEIHNIFVPYGYLGVLKPNGTVK